MLCYLLANSATAQTKDSTKKVTDTTKSVTDTSKKTKDNGPNNNAKTTKPDSAAAAAKKATKARIDSILNNTSSDIIARFEMHPSVKVYKYLQPTEKDSLVQVDSTNWKFKNPRKKERAHLDRESNRYYSGFANCKIANVHLLVREGMLMEIGVTVVDSGKPKQYMYRNKRTAIDLIHYEDKGSTHLQYVNNPYYTYGPDLFVFLDEVLSYLPLRSYSDVPYADFDITMKADTAHNYYNVKESTSLNSYFNVAAFTDIQGLGGDPNGVAQFQAEGKFITNTRTLGEGATVFGSYIAFEGGLSKYDSQFKGTMVYHPAKDSVNRRDLFQRSTYSVGVKFNLLRGFPSPAPVHQISDWQLNVGYNFVGSKIMDTTFKDAARTVIDTSYRTVTQNDLYIEPMFSLSRHGNFAMTCSMPLHFVSVKSSAKLKNDGVEHWIAPTIELMYFTKKDSNSKLFFRYRYLSSLDDHTQAFNQVQFGYSLNLGSVWSPPTAQ